MTVFIKTEMRCWINNNKTISINNINAFMTINDEIIKWIVLKYKAS